MSSASAVCEVRASKVDQTLREKIYDYLNANGTATADEIAHHLGIRLNSASTRCSELYKAGMIRIAREERNPATGHLNAAYQTVPREQAVPLRKQRPIFDADKIFFRSTK